jgi:hypothetical protein
MLPSVLPMLNVHSFPVQTKLFVTSDVPVFKVFSDDPNESRPQHLSDHLRSVMDDLVSVGLLFVL